MELKSPRGINWEHLLAEAFLFLILFVIGLYLISYENIVTTDVNGNVISVSRPRWNFFHHKKQFNAPASVPAVSTGTTTTTN